MKKHNPGPAMGGSVTAAESPAKARALAALHARRRGVRINQPPDDWESLLDQIRAATTPPRRGCSLRALALHVGVTHQAIGNWLAGIDVPAASAVSKIRVWLLQLIQE